MTTFLQPIRQIYSSGTIDRPDTKGVGKVIEEIILICDDEDGYSQKLAEVLIQKKELRASVRVCTSFEKMELLLEKRKIQVLLISEKIPYEQRKKVAARHKLVLTESHCHDLGEEEQEVKKYQSADKLSGSIMEACTVRTEGMKSLILGMYSPIHRIGKTTFSIKLGKALAENGNTLYLNLEAYAGMGGYFQNENGADLSQLLYYAKQESGDISVRIAAMVQQMGRLDFIPPMKVWTDLQEISVKEWQAFLSRMSQQSIYRTMILDFGDSVKDIFQVLHLCDYLIIPYVDDIFANAKLKQYKYMLELLGEQELELKSLYVDMKKNKRILVKETEEKIREIQGI